MYDGSPVNNNRHLLCLSGHPLPSYLFGYQILLMEIDKLNWEETLGIRHKVLWPNEDVSYCKVAGDESALHFGVKYNDVRVCVASIYTNGHSTRLRKFATLAEYQGKGVGTFMLNYLIGELRVAECNSVWLDARVSAIGFYTRFGFKQEGEGFFKNGVAYCRMKLYF